MRTIILLLIVSFQIFSLSAQDIIEEINEKYSNFSNGDILTSSDYTYKTGNFNKASTPYSNEIIGVYFNDNNSEVKDIRKYKNPIKISGITFVKYNSENGLIMSGDPVTSSSTPGEAMKATESGMILGIALEDASNSNGLVKIRILIQYVR